MGTKVTFDPVNLIVQVTQAPSLIDGEMKVQLDIQKDLYSDGKEDYLTDLEFTKIAFPVRAVGGDPLPGSKVLGDTYFLDSKWKIRPYAATHVFEVNGNLYSEDGKSPFIPVIGAYCVMVINTVSNLVDSTVQQLSEIEHNVFNDGVTVDDSLTGPDHEGTIYPRGTPGQPVNNIPDAISITNTRNFTRLYIINGQTFDTGDNIEGFEIVGESVRKSQITVNAGALTNNAEFRNCTVTGVFDDEADFYWCALQNIQFVYADIYNCVLEGTITLAGSGSTRIIHCYSGVAGTGTPTIDMGGSGQSLQVRGYSGGIKIINLTVNENISLDFISGHAKIDSTVTNGTIVIRGFCKVTNDSIGATVIEDHTADNILIILSRMIGLQQENQFIDQTVYTDHKLTSARIKLYSNNTSVGTDNDVIATYTLTAVYDGNGDLTTYKVVKV